MSLIILNGIKKMNLNSNKRNGMRRISVEIDHVKGYSFSLDMTYSTKQGSSHTTNFWMISKGFQTPKFLNLKADRI
jgi:hypothetical protein